MKIRPAETPDVTKAISTLGIPRSRIEALRKWCADGEYSIVYPELVKSVFRDTGRRLDALLAQPQEPSILDRIHDLACSALAEPKDGDTKALHDICTMIEDATFPGKLESVTTLQPHAPPAEPGLRDAAQAMLDAMDALDADGELDERIGGGELIDNLRAALSARGDGRTEKEGE